MAKKKTTGLPKELTTITPLSKFIALALFIALPFIGFYIGMVYQQSVQLDELVYNRTAVSYVASK